MFFQWNWWLISQDINFVAKTSKIDQSFGSFLSDALNTRCFGKERILGNNFHGEVAWFPSWIYPWMLKIPWFFSCCHPQICHFVLCRTGTLACKDSNEDLFNLHHHFCSHVCHRHCNRHLDIKRFNPWDRLRFDGRCFARPCRWHSYICRCIWSFAAREVEEYLWSGSVAFCPFRILHSHGSCAIRWIVMLLTSLDYINIFFSSPASPWAWRSWAFKNLEWPLTMQRFAPTWIEPLSFLFLKINLQEHTLDKTER